MNATTHLQSVRSKAVWGSWVALAIVIGCATILTSCGQAVREGSGNSYLIMTSLGGTNGAADKPRALDVLDKGCKLGDTQSCTSAAAARK